MLTNLACPIPISDYPTVTLAHGGGGRLTQMLIERMSAAGLRQPAARQPARRRRAGGATARGWPSPPTPTSSARSSSPAATSARWPCTARSTTWPCAARSRWPCRPASCWRKGCPWRTCGAWCSPCRPRRRTWACPSSPATPRWWTAARATASTSTPPASAWFPPGVQIAPRRARPGDLVLLSGAIAVHGIAIMSVREGLAFETDAAQRLGAAARPGGRDAGRPAATPCTCCATRRAAAWPAR